MGANSVPNQNRVNGALSSGISKKKGNANGSDMTEVEKKDEIIKSLEYRVEILQLKITKLEQLLALKDSKIQYLEGNKAANGKANPK